VCKENGYHVEPQRNFDGSNDHTTMVVSFPCKVPEHTPIGGTISAIDQLEMVKQLQTEWSDNSVSVTIYYTLEELPEVKEWLNANYSGCLKTVSFLLYSGHGFDQAPYETITKEEYDSMMEGTTPITAVTISEDDMDDFDGCENGACPVK
jgi:NTP pyrophosphatase (non-canonical NTP hydrolase)